MGEISFLDRLVSRLGLLPVIFAYRVIWLTARLGNRNAKDVLLAMWNAGLNVPGYTEANNG